MNKTFLQKIKDFFVFYILNPFIIYHYDSEMDNTINYIIKNAKSVYLKNNRKWIFIETFNGNCYALWNCNYPYGWLSLVFFSEINLEKEKNIFDFLENNYTILFKGTMPSRKKLIQFKDWLKNNCEEWKPLLDKEYIKNY